ncbi:class I adenylate-forming enzyme family protein [Peribacillus sp. SCS-155]|uniref:class I adenylate-forming enzyme family protein n=1 Tax=Peribacillus sedimenti TaxID=3115297 RepID=UPI0039065C49
MDIGSYLTQNARKLGSKLAIECDGRTYTYYEFNNQVNRLANGLNQLGIKKSDKVALLMKNSEYFAFSFFAIAKLGAVAVPINFRLTSSEVQYIVEQSNAKMVICDAELEDVIGEAKDNTEVRFVVIVGENKREEHVSYHDILAENSDEPGVAVLEQDDLEILYTSGTTGKPKGALFDHGRVFKVGVNMMAGMGLNRKDRLLHLAPLFHSAQLNLFLIPGVVLGTTHFIRPEFNPPQVLKDFQEKKISIFFGVPAMYNFLLQVPNSGEFDLSSVSRCGYGAAPMAPELVRKSMELFKTDQFYNLCGLTEGGPGGIMLEPDAHKDHLGKGGKPMYLTDARVVDNRGNDVRPGETGEMVLSGATMMKEYYNKPEETRQVFKDGWLYTGDLATIDDEGFITLVDRKKDMIITGGENVYSIEVESVLYEYPGILEAAVIGLPDEQWGETVCAILVPKEGAAIDESNLLSFCRKKLAGYKIPRKIFYEQALPRNASGKILKYQLRKKLQTFHV